MACEHLSRLKWRIQDGFITVPDEKHIKNVLAMTELGQRKPTIVATTPGVKRTIGHSHEEDELGDEH
eukprot:11726976-Alexandrium_andersonii.AAC.1